MTSGDSQAALARSNRIQLAIHGVMLATFAVMIALHPTDRVLWGMAVITIASAIYALAAVLGPERAGAVKGLRLAGMVTTIIGFIGTLAALFMD